MNVGKWMTTKVVTIGAEDPKRQAMDSMKKGGFRRVPVVEDKKVVGIITDRDIREATASPASTLIGVPVELYRRMVELIKNVKVKELMTKEVLTVTPETSVKEAAQILNDRKIGGLPVVEQEELVGVITETDLLKAFVNIFSQEKETVSE